MKEVKNKEKSKSILLAHLFSFKFFGQQAGSVIVTSLQNILRTEGFRGLYRGLSPTLAALLPNWAVSIVLFNFYFCGLQLVGVPSWNESLKLNEIISRFSLWSLVELNSFCSYDNATIKPSFHAPPSTWRYCWWRVKMIKPSFHTFTHHHFTPPHRCLCRATASGRHDQTISSDHLSFYPQCTLLAPSDECSLF